MLSKSYVLLVLLVAGTLAQQQPQVQQGYYLPANNPQPQQAVGEVPQYLTQVYQPQQDVYQPQQDVYQPQQDVYQPQQDVYKPQQDLYQPQQDVYQPQQDLYQAQQNVYQPQQGGYQPQQDLTQPQQEVYQPQQQLYAAPATYPQTSYQQPQPAPLPPLQTYQQAPADQQQQQVYLPAPATDSQPERPKVMQPVPDIVEQPLQTIYQEAVDYWTNNNCQYPPKDFYPTFQLTCNIAFDHIEFTPGICYAFFNSTKQVCNMDLDADTQKTLASVTTLQETMENDEVCDTLSTMKEEYPSLFPLPKYEHSWFERTYDLIFSDRCKFACGLKGAHPLCFGFFLSNEIMSSRIQQSSSSSSSSATSPSNYEASDVMQQIAPPQSVDANFVDSNAETPINAEILPDETVKQEETTDEDKAVIIKDPSGKTNNKSGKIFRPNPKLLLGQKLAGPDDYYLYNEDYLLNGEDDYPPAEEAALLNDYLGTISEKDIESTEVEKNDLDYITEEQEALLKRLNFNRLQLPEKLENGETGLLDLNSPLYDDDEYFGDETFNGKKLGDLNEEELKKLAKEEAVLEESWMSFGPMTSISTSDLMMNFVFLSIGILVLLILFVLFKASRRGFIRRIRLARPGRNWNYERVQNMQPDPEDYEQ